MFGADTTEVISDGPLVWALNFFSRDLKYEPVFCRWLRMVVSWVYTGSDLGATMGP